MKTLNQPKRQPKNHVDYIAMGGIKRMCTRCGSHVLVFDNWEDWKLGANGCGGRFDA